MNNTRHCVYSKNSKACTHRRPEETRMHGNHEDESNVCWERRARVRDFENMNLLNCVGQTHAHHHTVPKEDEHEVVATATQQQQVLSSVSFQFPFWHKGGCLMMMIVSRDCE